MDAATLESLWNAGKYEEALAGARAAQTDNRLSLAEALLRCASACDTPEWEDAARLAVSLREKAWPAGNSRAGYAAMPLAELMRRKGYLDEAEAVLRHCETVARSGAGNDSDPLRDIVFARARLHLAQGRDRDAEAAFLDAIKIEEAGRHPKRPPFTLPFTELQAMYQRQGRSSEAQAMGRRALAARKFVAP
jgi:ATP/maltotriose-dependent transcriptional regulator MalT